jgi:hypothetical protein
VIRDVLADVVVAGFGVVAVCVLLPPTRTGARVARWLAAPLRRRRQRTEDAPPRENT